MDKIFLINVARETLLFVRRSIVVIFLSVLVLGIIGFTIKWSTLIFQPESLLTNYQFIVQDIFYILVVYELLELFRTFSPNRLMSIVLLVLARKIILSPDDSHVMTEVISFAILLSVRLLWQRFGEKKNSPILK